MSEDKLGEVIETVKDAVELAEEVKEAVEAKPAPVPVNLEKGTKEVEEIFKALEVVGDFSAKIFADGQVNGADFIHAIDLVKNAQVFIDAADGIDKVEDELKDLDEAEMVRLFMIAYKIGKKVVAAVKLAKA